MIFPKKLGKISLYSVYNILKNKERGNTGITSDTAVFTVNNIRSWRGKCGRIQSNENVTIHAIARAHKPIFFQWDQYLLELVLSSGKMCYRDYR